MPRGTGRSLIGRARKRLDDLRRGDNPSQLSFADIIDGFRAVQDKYKDLTFFEPGGTLDLRRPIRGVVTIRIELPKVEYLHLASVLIEAAGVSDVASQTRTAVSSSWQMYRDALDSGLLFDPANRDLALHTKRDNVPWIEITFKQPADLRRILLRNRNDARSARARGIQVLARTGDGRWTTLYDGLLREREFAHDAEQRSARQLLAASATSMFNRGSDASTTAADASSSADPAKCSDLTRLLISIRLQDLGNVQSSIRRLELSAKEQQDLKSLINSRLLKPRSLEWSTHGVRRTFRFWSLEEKQHYIDFSLSVIDSLRSLNENVCFGFGSVLSIVRDHDLIPHDDDLDVIIGFEPEQAATLTDALDQVRAHLARAGFSTIGNSSANLNIRDRERFKKLDVFVGIFEADTIAWYPGRRGSLTRDMVFPPASRDLLGRACPIPREAERYLHELYGDGWKTPDPNFRHEFGKRKAEYENIHG